MTARALGLAALLCSAAALAACAGDAAARKGPPSAVRFEAADPQGWSRESRYFGLSQEEKKVYGYALLAPRETGSAPGPRARISAYYYAPGNLEEKSAEAYVKGRRPAAPAAGAAFPAPPKAGSGLPGGLKAELFSGVSTGRGGSHRIDAKPVETWEAYAVFPAKEGFYVLRLSASPDSYARWLPVFEEFIASFKPLLK